MTSQEQATLHKQTQETAPTSSNSEQTTASQPQSVADTAPETTKSSNPRLAAIAAKKATLEATLANVRSQRSALVAEAKFPSGLDMPADWSDEQRTKQALLSANAVIKEHIANLHRYNEIKDVGQGLMGLIADKRGVRVAEVMREYDMGEKD